MNQRMSFSFLRFFVKVCQGCLIGLGAVLPGISGGVLCVIFGIYRPVMELLAHPRRNMRSHIPMLFPVILGGMIGFLGIANLLSLLLDRYPSQSVCVFVGLIVGMLPSLFGEAGLKGRSAKSFFALTIGMTVIFVVLLGLRLCDVQIVPGIGWFLFCGFCLGLSLIVPGFSFSTLLMPLGLYEMFVSGIGMLDWRVLLPGAAGALITIAVLSKVVQRLFEMHYSVAFHGIIGIVIAATVMILPMREMFLSLGDFWLHCICIFAGVIVAGSMSRHKKNEYQKEKY